MDAQHTPGPWGIESCYDGGRTICEMRSAERLVCVNATEDADPRGYYATDANARLIAAAPDLLAALLLLKSWVDNWSPDFTNDPEWPGDAEKIRAAIAKAEGRAE